MKLTSSDMLYIHTHTYIFTHVHTHTLDSLCGSNVAWLLLVIKVIFIMTSLPDKERESISELAMSNMAQVPQSDRTMDHGISALRTIKRKEHQGNKQNSRAV